METEMERRDGESMRNWCLWWFRFNNIVW